jgi:hypothetical protein
MAFDVTDLFGNLFGGGPAVATAAMVASPDDDDGGRFADWVRRPDFHGRMGWEAPGMPEADRWWARCDFDDLPEVPEGFSIGELPEPAPRIAPGCVPGGRVDALDLDSGKTVQGQSEGLRGTAG